MTRISVISSGSLTALGVTWAAITPDSLIPLAALAAGAMVAVYGIARTSRDNQLKIWDARLTFEEKAHDRTRAELVGAKRRVFELSAELARLESDIRRGPDPDVPDAGTSG